MTANNRRFSRDRDNRMSISSSMTFDSLAREKLFDGSELFEVFQSSNQNSNDASNAATPPVQFIKTGKAAKRPSAMEFESGEFFAGEDLVDVFSKKQPPENDTGGMMSLFRRRSTVSRGSDRRGSMMSLVNDRRESLMSLMSLADCSLIENPSHVEDAQQQNAKESDTAKVQDATPPSTSTESERTNVVDNTNKTTISKSHNDSFSNVNNSNNDSFSHVNSSNNDSFSNANINTNINSKNTNLDSFSSANNNQSTTSDAEEKGKDGVEYIQEIGPYDIICGRNNGAHNWVGNRRFRITIMMNLKKYTEAPSREEKTQVIKSVIELLLNTDEVGARFIKKVGEGTYVRLKDKQIREKVGHAFRDMISLAEQEGGKLEAKCFQ